MMMPDTKARVIAAMAEQGVPVEPPAPAPKKATSAMAKRAPRSAPLSLDLSPLDITSPAGDSPLSLEMPTPLALTSQLQGRQFLNTPSRVGARPGDTKINQLDLSQGTTSGKNRNAYMSADEYEALTQAAMQTAPNRALQQGIDAQQAFYDETVRGMPPRREDLSSLMAMTDAMTGSRFAGSYKAPESYMGSRNFLAGLQDRTQNSRERLAQLLMNETGGIKQGADEQGYKSGMDESQKTGFSVPNPQRPSSGMGGSPTNVRGFYNTFENSDTVKEGSKLIQAANSVQGHLQNPNWLGDAAARAGILQAMRLAPVSNLDVKQITGSADLFNQFNQLMGRITKGDVFTPRDRAVIEKYNDYLQKKGATNLEKAADEYSRAHAPFYGFDYQTGRALLKPAIPLVEKKEAPVPRTSRFMDILREEVRK